MMRRKYLQFEAVIFYSNKKKCKKKLNSCVYVDIGVCEWANHTHIPVFGFLTFSHIFKHLKQVQKWSNYKHQPLNIKVLQARLMRNTGLCLRISSRLDSAWPETNEASSTTAQESNSYLPSLLFFFWLVILHSKYNNNH